MDRCQYPYLKWEYQKNLLKRVMLFFVLVRGNQLIAYPTPTDFDGNLGIWTNISIETPLRYEVIASDDQSTQQALTLVNSAAVLWSSIPSSRLRLKSFENSVDDFAEITIELVSDLEGSPDAGAYTLFDKFDPKNGPEHCVIRIREYYLNYNISFAKTILHELGHCIGLSHSLIPQSIMSYQLGKNGFYLDIDDVAAVTRLYPLESQNPSIPPGCSIRSPSFPGNIKWDICYMILILVLIKYHLKKRGNPKVPSIR